MSTLVLIPSMKLVKLQIQIDHAWKRMPEDQTYIPQKKYQVILQDSLTATQLAKKDGYGDKKFRCEELLQDYFINRKGPHYLW
jgi:hypothetical protein